jgi:hypothetical protein
MKANDIINITRTAPGGDIQSATMIVVKVSPKGMITAKHQVHTNWIMKFDKQGREIGGSKYTYWRIS